MRNWPYGWRTLGIVGLLLGTGCPDSGTNALPGHEGGPCIEDECLQGLMCLSEVCVAPDTAMTDPSATTTATSGPNTPTTTSTDPATTTAATDPTSVSDTTSMTGPVTVTDGATSTGELSATGESESSGGTTTAGTTTDDTTTDDTTTDGTTTGQVPALCGDGNLDPGEACDKGAANSDTGACKTDCTLATCGDGHKGPKEGCDDGNNNNGDGCNKDCALPNQAQWVRTVGGQSPAIDEANSVVVDASDNIILGGRLTPGGPGSLDAVVLKLTPAGHVTWQKLFAGTGSSDTAYAVAVDAAGTIYAGGQEMGPNNLTQGWVRALTPEGVQTWNYKLSSPLGAAVITGLGVAANGDLVAAGHLPAANNLSDVWLRRFTPAGAEIWTTTYDNPVSKQTDNAYDMTIASNGDILITGRSTSLVDKLDYMTVRFTGGGAPLWDKYFDYMGKFDMARGIGIDPLGNAVVVGYTDAVVHAVRYAPDGTQGWVYQTSGNAWTAVCDAAGNSYIAGGKSADLALWVLDPGGALKWSYTYDHAGKGDAAFDVALDSFGNVILAGYAETGSDRDILVIKYAPG